MPREDFSGNVKLKKQIIRLKKRYIELEKQYIEFSKQEAEVGKQYNKFDEQRAMLKKRYPGLLIVEKYSEINELNIREGVLNKLKVELQIKLDRVDKQGDKIHELIRLKKQKINK